MTNQPLPKVGTTNPITPEQIARLKEMKANFPAQKAAIDKAKQAGLDVSIAEETYNQHKAMVDKLLQVYG